MEVDGSPPLNATPFHELLETFKLANKTITISELVSIINNLPANLKIFTVEAELVSDFKKLVIEELSKKVDMLFQKITRRIIDTATKPSTTTKPSIVKAIEEWEADPTNSQHFTKLGTFKINVNFEYIDKMLATQKKKSVTITYGELLTKYTVFKNAIQSAFAKSGLITTQSEFITNFFNDAVNTLNMRVSTARDFFDTAGVSAQCDAADNIDWPAEYPTPKRFEEKYPTEKKNWRKYCYICGLAINTTYPSQCEHILPVFEACTFNCLIQVSSDMNTASSLHKALYKLEYAGSHPCCNILKSNNSFITIDTTKDPPISINSKYILKLINLIITRSQNPEDSLECFKLLGHILIPEAEVRKKDIEDNYLKDLVAYLNSTLKANDGTFATSGIIALFLTINQFIAFEPAIEQTIIGILTGGTIKKRSNILFHTHATNTFLTRDLEQVIMKLEFNSTNQVDVKNYLDIIGYIDETPSEYKELIATLSGITAYNRPRGLAIDVDYEFETISDLMSHFEQFFININFLNTNNYDTSEMINSDYYIPEKYPHTIRSNLLELKIKYFFATLLKQFYPYVAEQSSFSNSEKLSLLHFCKAYIGLEFVYIIIYYRSKVGFDINSADNSGEKSKLKKCQDNYKDYYIDFITKFFIYQSIHILSSAGDNSLTPDNADGPDTILQKKNTIIYHSGQTYYDMWQIILLEHKDWFTKFITDIKAIITNCEAVPTKLPLDQEELIPITLGVAPIYEQLFGIFETLFDSDSIFKKILTIYNVDGSQTFKKKITQLPDKPSIGFGAVMHDADAVMPVADAHAPAYNSMQNGGIKRKLDSDYIDEERISDIMRHRRGNVEAELKQFITDLKSINAKIIINELQTRSSRSEITKYELRPNPTQLLQFNLGHNITRLIINEAEGIHICIYNPAYILTIYRCILIDTKFVTKIEEMIENKYVFSNGELLDTSDIELLKNLIDIQKDILGRPVYNKLRTESTFFTEHPKYLPLFEKCNLFLYYDTADNSVRDIYDNKLYASNGGTIQGGKKYYKKITKKLKNKKIVKKTRKHKLIKHKLIKHKSRKHKSRKHKSRKHKSKLTKTLKKKI